jgi:hypothetical protein
MSYEHDYFVLKKVDEDKFPNLVPLKESASLRFNRKLPEPGQSLEFHNKWREDNKQAGIKEEIGSILFNGFDVLVNDDIHTALKIESFYNVGFYPSTYIKDDGERLDHYYFLTVVNKIDAWCRTKSIYDADNVAIGNKYYINKIVLDEAVLNNIPLEQRLLFKLDASMLNVTLIHKTLLEKIQVMIDTRIAVPLAEFSG